MPTQWHQKLVINLIVRNEKENVVLARTVIKEGKELS
jgi:hypothetical protein